MQKLLGAEENDTDMPGHIVRRVARLEARAEELDPRITMVEQATETSIRKVGFIRFNPFQDTGGDNSFTVVLLDLNNTGVILSSLYMRDGVRLYGKAVERGTSKHVLSDEEKSVLEQTIKQA